MSRLVAIGALFGLCFFGAGASAEGVIVRGSSLDSGVLGTSVSLPDGRWVDLRSLVLSSTLPPYVDSDLLVHDLKTGRTQLGDPALANLAAFANVGEGAAPLEDFLLEAGALFAFDQDAAALALLDAPGELWLHDPLAGGGGYRTDPTATVPEPGVMMSLWTGALALGALRLSTRRSRSLPRRSLRS
ncbi:MAG: hypothetical protein AB8G23_11935 [Myxococcota bacterium]